MPTLVLEDVWKTYDRVRYVLAEVSLVADKGSVTTIVGRSGSGKTTLLNILAGLERPTRGRVLADGVDLETLDEEQRAEVRRDHIGIVFQRFHLLPELTVEENVRLPLSLARRPGATERAARVLSFFGVGHIGSAFPATLSGGETQRVAIARALANDPALLLADEPTANLDDENSEVVLGALRQVADEVGAAVVVASHDARVRAIGDRVLRISDGRLAAEAP